MATASTVAEIEWLLLILVLLYLVVSDVTAVARPAIQAALFSHEMILVGDGRPTCHCGATLWNNAKDDIAKDAPGVATAKNLGRRVAEVALRLAGR